MNPLILCVFKERLFFLDDKFTLQKLQTAVTCDGGGCSWPGCSFTAHMQQVSYSHPVTAAQGTSEDQGRSLADNFWPQFGTERENRLTLLCIFCSPLTATCSFTTCKTSNCLFSKDSSCKSYSDIRNKKKNKIKKNWGLLPLQGSY